MGGVVDVGNDGVDGGVDDVVDGGVEDVDDCDEDGKMHEPVPV